MIYNFFAKNIAYILRFVFLMYGLQLCDDKKVNGNVRREIKYIIAYILFLNINNNVRLYLLQRIVEIVIIILCYEKGRGEKAKNINNICKLCYYQIMYEIINVSTNIVSSMLFYFIFPNFEKNYIVITCSIVLKCVFCYCAVKMGEYKGAMDRQEWSYVWVYGIITCAKIPFLYTDIRDAFEWKVIFLTIICCTVIFFIISKIEKRNAEQEKARIQENNKILSTKLHKSREILPAMVQVLSNVTKSNGIEMEQQEAHKLLQEVNDLYGQQLKENSKEDLQLKSFCSTGLTILDQQLSFYQREAIEKDINFDIYVQAPINELLKKDDIDQLRLQRALGDLVRNAFRVMEREDKKCQTKGHILLIIGCKYEDILEIGVVDNGAPFPLYVIETFGKRGVTTGGMGNGLADLVEFAKEIKASICLDEFEGRANSFTKKISIVFDKREKNYFNSVRSGLITGPFWSTI